jgi:hypothetical protein
MQGFGTNCEAAPTLHNPLKKQYLCEQRAHKIALFHLLRTIHILVLTPMLAITTVNKE